MHSYGCSRAAASVGLARVCLSRPQQPFKRACDLHGPFAAAVVESQRAVFSLSASTQHSCLSLRAPRTDVDPTLMQDCKQPGDHIQSGRSEEQFIAEFQARQIVQLEWSRRIVTKHLSSQTRVQEKGTAIPMRVGTRVFVGVKS